MFCKTIEKLKFSKTNPCFFHYGMKVNQIIESKYVKKHFISHLHFTRLNMFRSPSHQIHTTHILLNQAILSLSEQ